MGEVTISIRTLVCGAIAIALAAAYCGLLVSAVCRGWAEESKRIDEGEER